MYHAERTLSERGGLFVDQILTSQVLRVHAKDDMGKRHRLSWDKMFAGVTPSPAPGFNHLLREEGLEVTLRSSLLWFQIIIEHFKNYSNLGEMF